MDFSNKIANELLYLPKSIFINDKKEECIQVNTYELPINIKYNAFSDDGDYEFLIEIRQSAKHRVNITLHFQEDETKIGLLRIDYCGQHKNPELLNEYVPDYIRPYAGACFGYNEHHIHYHVQGYRTLAWAIPLQIDEFSVKKMVDFTSLRQALVAFSKKINLTTEIILVEERLFL